MSEQLPRPPFESTEPTYALAHEPDPGAASIAPWRPGEGGEEGTGAPLRRYLAAVLRYKWAILAFGLLGGLGGWAGSKLVVPQFEAQGTIWIETSGREMGDAGPIRTTELLRSTAWLALLRSYVVLDHVVMNERLFLSERGNGHHPVFDGLELGDRLVPGTYRLRVEPASQRMSLDREGVTIQQAAIGDSLGQAVGLKWVPGVDQIGAETAIEFRLSVPRDVSQQLAGQLETEFDLQGNFLRIRLDGSDPERVASILNAVMDRYVEVAAELKRARLEELVSILNDQLRYAEDNLRESEIALEGFRVQTITLPADRSTPVTPGLEVTRDPVFANFFNMRIELEQIRRSQETIRGALASLGEDDAHALAALESVEAVQRSSDLVLALGDLTRMKAEHRALLFRYTPEHPPVQQLANDIRALERGAIPRLASGVLADLASRERQLDQRLGAASSELRQIPPRMIEEARLTRGVAIADNLYTMLQRRYEEARLAAVSSVPDIRILDAAIAPNSPTSDQRLLILAFGLFAGLGLGLVGAVVLDRMDRRLRYPEQVTHELGLPILGAIPRIKSKRGLMGDNQRSQAEEAFRTLRLSLVHAYGSAGPIVVTVTSPGPGDGKSFVTGNLGMFFANLGRKTVIIDADVRRGSLHRLLGVDRVPGLTDYLRDGTDVVMPGPTQHPNLWLACSGSRIKDGPELLSSKRMRDFLQSLRADFDVILVDSPPLGAGVDAFALGTWTGNVLLVLRTGTTDRELADAKLGMLDRLPIRLLGAVLNGVPATREYKYYSYVSGYESYDEERHEEAVALPASGRQAR